MLKIALLGRPQITFEDESVTGFVSNKALLLLCYLAMHPTGQSHARITLATLLWGEMDDERSRANLRMALYNLQQLLPDVIAADRKTLTLPAEGAVWLDVAAFRAVVEAADPAPADLAAAVDLYRGEFLQGLAFDDAPELEEWLRLQRESLRLQALDALERLAALYITRGAWPAAIDALRRQLAIEPWREESHRLLIRLLARTEQFSAALTQYETCRALLDAELGVAPMEETAALYKRILAARRRPRQHNLPLQPTPLVGREEELGRLFSMLDDPNRRLITIAGPGGSGKSRLAVAAAAAQAYAYLDGVYFAPLAGVTTGAGLETALAGALPLGSRGNAGQDDRTRLLDFVRHKELLLVLDNVEQILDPAADLVITLLETAPRLKILATSTAYLQLRWESRLPLAGLPTPPERSSPDGDPLAFAAVRLFLQVGRRVRPGFDLAQGTGEVAAFCRLVEGIPLAIELGAALLDRETPAQLLDRVRESLDSLVTPLRDVPDRHRSPRAVFAHSWGLLSTGEQKVFARLALFRGGFTPAAAAAVALAHPAQLDVLVVKSLLRHQPGGRYELHELLRQYAREELDRQGEVAETAARLAAFFVDELRAAEAALAGREQIPTARRLRADLDNILTAWEEIVARRDEGQMLAAAPALARFCRAADLFQLGNEALAAAVEAAAPAARPPLLIYHAQFLVERQEFDAALAAVSQAQALGLDDVALQAAADLTAGHVYQRQGDLAAAREALRRGISAAEKAGALDLQADCWRMIGTVEEQSGEYGAAEAAMRRALALYETTGDPTGVALSKQGLGIVYFRRADYGTARQLLLEALDARRAIDPTGLGEARILVSLGSITYNLGERAEARRYFEEAQAVFQQVGDRMGGGLAADMLGRMAAFAADYGAAEVHYERSLALRNEIGFTRGVADTERHLGDLTIIMGDFDRGENFLKRAGEKYAALDDRRSIGSTLTSRGILQVYRGDYAAAGRLGEEAMAVAVDLDNNLLRAYALRILGLALRGEERWREADPVLAEAVGLWEQLGMVDMASEMCAARAVVLLAAGRQAEALAAVEKVVARLDQPLPLDCDAPGALYYDCVLVLQAAGDGRAAVVRERGLELLQRQASQIEDEGRRRLFWENIPAHRALRQLP